MSTERTPCGHCGFTVPVGEQCPLCEHDLETGRSLSDTLAGLFGD